MAVIGVTQIAKRAKVSKGIVSRYLNADPTLKIKPETQERIEMVKEQLGITLTPTPRGSRRRLTYNFVIPINRIFYGIEELGLFNSPIFKSFEAAIKEEKFRSSVTFFDNSDKHEIFKDLIFRAKFCDGILLVTNTIDERGAELILENNMPHVSLEPRDENLGLNTVSAHSLLGIRQAVKHLTELGHVKIGFVGQKQFYRYMQFVTTIFEYELPFDDKLNVYLSDSERDISKEQFREIAKLMFLRHLQNDNVASAYLCNNDLIAFGVIDAIREKGLVPGRDISVIGYDNIEQRESYKYSDSIEAKENYTPILTTIDNPLDTIGKRCGEILLNQVFHKQMDIVHEHIPTKLIVRNTTGPCPKDKWQH